MRKIIIATCLSGWAAIALADSALVQDPASGHWYRRFDASMTWHDAASFCAARAGSLAAVTSAAEDGLVYGDVAAGGAPRWSWLGATDQLSEGIWSWVTEEPFVYSGWAGGEPNDCNGIEHYLMYFTPPDGRAGAWNDLGTGLSSFGVPGGCGCGGCADEWYRMSTLCEFRSKPNLPASAPAGLLAWWPGDGTAAESAGGRDGTLESGATFAAGAVSKAFSFTAAGGSRVSVLDDPAWTLTQGDFTVDAWVKFRTVQGRDPFVAHDDGGGPNAKWIFWYDATGHDKLQGQGALRFHINSEGDLRSLDPVAVPWSPVPGRWYHVAVTRTGTTYSLFVDGALVGSDVEPAAIPDPAAPLTIGNAEAYFFDGEVDEVELFRRGLAPAEVKAIYDAGASGKFRCAPLPAATVSLWRAAGDAADSAGANPGTLVGNVTFEPGVSGQAFRFPGETGSYVHVPHSADLNPAGAFSIQLWVNGLVSEQPGSDGLFSLVDKSHGFIDGTGWVVQGSVSYPGCQDHACEPGEVMFGFGAGNDPGSAGDFVIATTRRNVLDGAWHHLAGVFTGTELRMYVDGELTDVRPHANPPVNNDRDVALGRHADPVPVREYRGLLDEVSFVQRALSPLEVRQAWEAGGAGQCRARTVAIDVRPGSATNPLNPAQAGTVPVALLTTPGFDAALVDRATVRFGPTGTEAAAAGAALQDADGDGDLDVVFRFPNSQAGFRCGQTQARLTGLAPGGLAIVGVDAILTVGCAL